MSISPSEYQAKLNVEDYVRDFQDPADERIEVGVLFVGAGPANLSAAIRLLQLLEEKPEMMDTLGEVPVAIVEKGRYPGAHLLSGAVVNPGAYHRLFPGLAENDLPFHQAVEDEAVYYLTRKGAIRVPVLPPTMKNHGNYVASLSKMGAWLAEKAEALGAMILNETTAARLIVTDGAVKGVRTGDKGLDREGNQLPNFEAGGDIEAKVTVLGEGTQGHLSQLLIEHFGLKRINPQIYALGVKEIWEVAKPLDRVIHTMGWPLKNGREYHEFGGSFVYPMGPDKVSVGLVVGMDYRNASISTHDLLQKFKLHPLIREILKGGKRSENGWGAKTIPEGGYYSLPNKYHVPGAILVGDSAGFVNVPSLKGIHYAMWSGIFAAEAIFEKLESAGGEKAFLCDNFDKMIQSSFITKDLYEVRNMRQAFQYGFVAGSMLAGLMTLTGGLFPGWRFSQNPDAASEMMVEEQEYPKPDNESSFDKLNSVFASGNRSRDDQPDHLIIRKDVPEIIGQTWINMCPAEVYEWKEGPDGQKLIQTNPTNCVQCGAIGAKGGRLSPPEGGSGPEYNET